MESRDLDRVKEEQEVTPVPGLAKTVRRGAVISALALGVTTVISIVSTIWLARLLSPVEVGIYTGATLLITFIIQSSQGGMRLALVQRQGDIDDAADVVFWATAALGLLGGLAAIASAPVLGHLFRSDLVTAVAVSTAGLVLLESLTQVPDGLMQRNFNFLRKLVVDPSRAIAYMTVSVVLAASGFGVWSMVIGQYAGVIVWLIASWLLARWRPGRGRPTWQLWRELARFSYPLIIANVVEYVRSTAQMALAGRVLGQAALGNYRYGLRLGQLPGLAVFEIGSYVLFPAFSRFATDAKRFHAAFLRALRWMWFAAAPVAALVVALGVETVVVLLGDPWRDAGLFLVAMAGAGLGQALQGVASEAIKAAGRSALFHWTSAIELVLGIGLIIVLLPFGLLGVGLAMSVTELAIGFGMLALSKPIVGFRIGAVARILALPTIAAGVSLAVVVALSRAFLSPIGLPMVSALAVLVALALSLVLIYLIIMAVLDRQLVVALVGKVNKTVR